MKAMVSSFKERFAELLEFSTYEKASADLGIAKSTISAYVTGERVPKRPVLVYLAYYFNVSPEWLLGYDVPKKPKALTNGEGLSPDQRYLITKVREMTPAQVRSLRSIVEEVSSMRSPAPTEPPFGTFRK